MRKEYRPMLATLIDKPFDDAAWVFETKWDGFRLIADIKKSSGTKDNGGSGRVTLYSRNGKDITAHYPTIAAALAKIKHRAVLDGELVALDAKGRSRFQLLQNALHERARLQYCVFDLLFIDGKDVRKKALLERKKLLNDMLPTSSLLRFSQHTTGNGIARFARAKRERLEGIMAKRAAGPYHSGKRTREWLKIKTTHGQEVVIVGFTAPRRSRKHFGALVLAVNSHKGWQYVGRAGTGFDAGDLKSIHAKLTRLVTHKKPIAAAVPEEASTTWVRPVLVGEIKFTEWTTNGEMRHPAFLGLRTDKPARQVVREYAK